MKSAELPLGRLDLMLNAHDASTTVILFNDKESGPHPITDEERNLTLRVVKSSEPGQAEVVEASEPERCAPN